MQKLTLAALAASCLLAAPVMAQTNTTPPAATSQGAQAPTMSQADLQKLQTKITDDLKNDGYTKIQVMPNSFLVHAVNKHNDPVMMIINPDSVFSVTQVPPGQAVAGNSGASSSGSKNTPTKQ